MPAPGVKYPHRVMTSLDEQTLREVEAEAQVSHLPVATVIRNILIQRYEQKGKGTNG